MPSDDTPQSAVRSPQSRLRTNNTRTMASEGASSETNLPPAAEVPNICLPESLPGYNLGDEGKPNHFIASTSRESAGVEAKTLNLGDAAFIKRSDLKWTYAVVSERVEEAKTDDSDKPGTVILRFEVDQNMNRKSFPEAQWGKYIRVIKVEESELERLKAEETAKEAAEEGVAGVAAATAAVVSEAAMPQATAAEASETMDATKECAVAPPETAPATIPEVGEESTKSVKIPKSNKKGSKGGSSWFSGIFGGGGSISSKSKKSEEGSKATEATSVGSGAPTKDETRNPAAESNVAGTEGVRSSPVATTEEESATDANANDATPIVVKPMTEDPAEVVLAAPPKEEAATPAVAPDGALAVASQGAPATAPAVAAEVNTGLNEVDEKASESGNTKENSNPDADKGTIPEVAAAPSTSDARSSSDSSKAKEKKETSSSLRSPLSMKNPLSLKKSGSIVNKIFNKNKDKKEPKAEETKKVVSISTSPPPTNVYLASPAISDPRSPKMSGEKKEWFDPQASEVDYDKNPTDLFQALEARQFSYAEEMYKQVNKQFTKDCATWVVARGQKKKESQLRFRALPLHAALVFGAEDDMILKILNAYPMATRGRDVKGRLPIHLAMEHNASELVVGKILEAFPKGFFARDKKNCEPLDYVEGNTDRAHLKKIIPLVTAARIEDERSKWDTEKEELLEAQKVALREDPDYMKTTVEKVTEDVEKTYATKMELLEINHQKEISLLKQRHDSETQALLEGFAVKMDFERKLNKLKSKG